MRVFFTHTQRVRLLACTSLLLLYALSSLAHFSYTQTPLYQSDLPQPNPLGALAPCDPDTPPPDTSLCRHCTLLTSSTHSHCIECNTTQPVECDPRSASERAQSHARHHVRLLHYKRQFINAYARNHGWLMRILPRSEYMGDRNPLAVVCDDILEWALTQPPLAIDPVVLGTMTCFLVVVLATAAALVYEKMITDADYRDRANALAHSASAAITGHAERVAEQAAAAEASSGRMPDIFGLDRKNQ